MAALLSLALLAGIGWLLWQHCRHLLDMGAAVAEMRAEMDAHERNADPLPAWFPGTPRREP